MVATITMNNAVEPTPDVPIDSGSRIAGSDDNAKNDVSGGDGETDADPSLSTSDSGNTIGLLLIVFDVLLLLAAIVFVVSEKRSSREI